MTATTTTVTVNAGALRVTNSVLTAGMWLITLGVIGYSLMTSTPFVAAHSAWTWSGPALGLMTDIAFVMALQAESVLSRYGVTSRELGPWPLVFRWFTGGATTFLNVWGSVGHRDWTGVAVHLIAPVLLMLVAEVSPVYRAAMSRLIATAEAARVDTVAVDQVSTPVYVDTRPVSTPVAEVAPELAAPLVGSVDTPVSTPVSTPVAETVEVDSPVVARLSTEAARKVIEQGWKDSLSTRDVAAAATRHPSFVARVYRELETARGPQPAAGQLALVKAEATA